MSPERSFYLSHLSAAKGLTRQVLKILRWLAPAQGPCACHPERSFYLSLNVAKGLYVFLVVLLNFS